jgi:hypothetical protein
MAFQVICRTTPQVTCKHIANRIVTQSNSDYVAILTSYFVVAFQKELRIQLNLCVNPWTEGILCHLHCSSSTFFAETTSMTIQQVIPAFTLEKNRSLHMLRTNVTRISCCPETVSELIIQLLDTYCVRIVPTVICYISINSIFINHNCCITSSSLR